MTGSPATNERVLDATIRLALGLPDDAALKDAGYGRTVGWDSVGHTELVVALEAAFGISIEPDHVFDMTDYGAVRRVLQSAYGVDLHS